MLPNELSAAMVYGVEVSHPFNLLTTTKGAAPGAPTRNARPSPRVARCMSTTTPAPIGVTPPYPNRTRCHQAACGRSVVPAYPQAQHGVQNCQ
jgi:hypothetical protein